MEAVLECVRCWDDGELANFLAECYPGEPVHVDDEVRTYHEPSIGGVSVTPCDDGTALVADDGGNVLATIRPRRGLPVDRFHAAMRALDARYDQNDWGHG